MCGLFQLRGAATNDGSRGGAVPDDRNVAPVTDLLAFAAACDDFVNCPVYSEGRELRFVRVTVTSIH